MEQASKEALMAARLGRVAVPIPGVGVVVVRGMTVEQQFVWSKLAGGDATRFSQLQLAGCLVDPVLTEGEAGHWMAAAPAGEVQSVIAAINAISGTDKEAKELQKEIFKSVREATGLGVSHLAGPETGPDSE